MYRVDEGIFRQYYKAFHGKDPTHEDYKSTKAVGDVLMIAFEAFQKGKTITDLAPWIVEATTE